MIKRKLGRWLLVALALVALAFAAPIVSAHGEEATQEDEPAADGMPNGDTTGWAAWMDGHMTGHVGPHTVEEMESHTGVTVDAGAENMTDDNHRVGGANGQGHGC